MKFKKFIAHTFYFKKMNKLCCAQIFITIISIGLVLIVKSSVSQFITKKYDDIYDNVIYNNLNKRVSYSEIKNNKSSLDVNLINKKLNNEIVNYDYYIQDSSIVMNSKEQFINVNSVYCNSIEYCAQNITTKRINIGHEEEGIGAYVSKKFLNEFIQATSINNQSIEFYPKQSYEFKEKITIKGYYEFKDENYNPRNEIIFFDHSVFDLFEKDFIDIGAKFSIIEMYSTKKLFDKNDINILKQVLPNLDSKIIRNQNQTVYFNKIFIIIRNIFAITLVVMFFGIVFTFFTKTEQEKNIIFIKKTFYQTKTKIILILILSNSFLYLIMIFLVFLIFLPIQFLYKFLFDSFFIFNTWFYCSLALIYFGIILGTLYSIILLKKNTYDNHNISIGY